jgi:hypothetical protein
MAEDARAPALVVAAEAEWAITGRIWGTGGWLPPEEREALDWLTLARLLGWGVTVTRRTNSGLDAGLAGGARWLIVACDPDRLGEELVGRLAARLAAEPILLVARAGARDGAFARLAGATRGPEQVRGRSVRWIGAGPGRRWRGRTDLDSSALELSPGTAAWATLDGAPLVAARPVGRGVVATLGFHPSRMRDVDGAATALLKHLLIWGCPDPVAWLELEGTLVLRMDDPGGAQNVHSRSWSHVKLGEADWAAIGADLRRRDGRMSIGYVAGWVDDGDAMRGELEVAGHPSRRVPGRVHPSPLVTYRDRAGHAPGMLHDYDAESRGIRALRAAGLAEVEMHGHTHMHPDSAAWAQAPDRYEAMSWYRELGSPADATIAARPPDEHPLALGLAAFRRFFDVHPTTLICPGEQFTNAVLERALDLGFQLVGSYYLALRDGERFCWSQHVCAPYLDLPRPAWFDAGLPVVGYFHDRDLALEGVGWMGRWLDRWQAAGARRLLDFRELAAAVGRRFQLEPSAGGPFLRVTNDGAPTLVRPVTVGIRVPGGRLPSRMPVSLDERNLTLNVHSLGDGLGRVVLPRSPAGADLMTGNRL